jgi:enoyl-CoA hydratase
MREATLEQAREFSEKGARVMHALEALPVPVIALVNGYALGGGCELALACDWVLASDQAVFGQPEVNLGILPGFGGTQRLPRRIGTARALELLTTARQVKAAEAAAIGLANQVYPAAELRARGLEAARLIASKGPAAVRAAKLAVQRGANLDLFAACALETDLFVQAFATRDRKEGMSAFLEKRPAKFEGHQNRSQE